MFLIPERVIARTLPQQAVSLLIPSCLAALPRRKGKNKMCVCVFYTEHLFSPLQKRSIVSATGQHVDCLSAYRKLAARRVKQQRRG